RATTTSSAAPRAMRARRLRPAGRAAPLREGRRRPPRHRTAVQARRSVFRSRATTSPPARTSCLAVRALGDPVEQDLEVLRVEVKVGRLVLIVGRSRRRVERGHAAITVYAEPLASLAEPLEPLGRRAALLVGARAARERRQRRGAGLDEVLGLGRV